MTPALVRFAWTVLLSGCTSGVHVPQLPGPADSVDCILQRHDSLEGTYRCSIKGRYQMEKIKL